MRFLRNGLEYSQVELIEAVCSTNTPNKPVVLVVIAGHSIDLTVAKQHCGAILFAFLPSQFGGDAIAEVLLGGYSPAGRLPVTFYDRSINDRCGRRHFLSRVYINTTILPRQARDKHRKVEGERRVSCREKFKPEEMGLRHGDGVTYQHYRGTALYEFGFGLSYSTFSFEWSKPPSTVSTTQAVAAADEGEQTALEYRVTVTNTGGMAAGVAVLAFVNTSAAALEQAAGGTAAGGGGEVELAAAAVLSMPTPPLRKLFNFTRVFLQPGASAELSFSLGKEALALSDDGGDQAVRAGQYTVAIGGVGRAGRVEDGARTVFFATPFYTRIKTEHLPRQARDKDRKC